MESKASKRGVLRVNEVEVEECNVLGVVQQSAAWCT